MATQTLPNSFFIPIFFSEPKVITYFTVHDLSEDISRESFNIARMKTYTILSTLFYLLFEISLFEKEKLPQRTWWKILKISYIFSKSSGDYIFIFLRYQFSSNELQRLICQKGGRWKVQE